MGTTNSLHKFGYAGHLVLVFAIVVAVGNGVLPGASLQVGDEGYGEFQQALGFQVGSLSGSGLSYQYWDGDTGWQFAFGALYYSPENDNYWYGNILDYTFGAEVQHSVYGDNFANWLSGRLYLFGAVNHRGYIDTVVVDYDPYTTEYGTYNPIFSVGGGIGIEVILFDHFSFPVELGYGLFWNPTKAALRDQFMVDIVPQAGFRYRY